jgi:DNA-binding LacI/PurR family transcriptional regulator
LEGDPVRVSASDGEADLGARRRRRRGPVMADVARVAGVSHQTVSRVLNDSGHVRPETRARVMRAVRELDYRPNRVARALVTGRSQTLGVVSFDTTLYGPASTLFGIERAAHAADYAVSIVSVTTLDRASVASAVEWLGAQGVDGILVITPQESAADAVLHLPEDLPVVAVEAGPEHAVPVVTVDQVAGAVAATRHLLELGHRTVWHVAGPSDWLEARQRIDGWQSALEAAAADVPPVLSGDWSARSGYELGRRLVTVRDVTAVFAANDQMALGILRALHEAGRDVPRELSIVGFDDIPEAQYFTPPLTTVRQDFMEMGRQSLVLLLGEMGSARSSPRVVVQPELMVRESTASPAWRSRRQ